MILKTYYLNDSVIKIGRSLYHHKATTVSMRHLPRYIQLRHRRVGSIYTDPHEITMDVWKDYGTILGRHYTWQVPLDIKCK